MKKKLFFDVDGTICKSPKRVVQIYNEEFNQNSNWEECNKWDFSDVCPLLLDAESYFSRPDFYKNQLELTDPYIKGIISLLFISGYEIYFITIGSKDNLEHKKNWLIEQFPYVLESNMILLEKLNMGKAEIDMQGGILIDDNYINLLTSNADEKICMHKRTEWNEGVERSGFVRLKDSLELYNYIIKLEKEGRFDV